MAEGNKIKVTVDKSHLFTLGEKMYRESIEFVRELVSNAYDADATEVRVYIEDERISVEDDGGGMNEKGLQQFFTIGSEEKRVRNVSPKFGRKRIGQFGIGKFSALSLADQFIIESVKGAYKYSVTFDRADWQTNAQWELPIKKEKRSPLNKDGTRMILNNLTKKISIAETEKYLKKSVPLRAKKFAIYLNNKRVTAKTVAGRSVPIAIKTMYGPIEGEIVIAINPRDVDEPGIECRVKQIFIKRELFGVNKKFHQGINRVTGYVNADFLPLISARSDFITDTPEYKLFAQLIETELVKLMKTLKAQKNAKNIQKINRELKDIMEQIREALKENPDFVPQGKAVTRLKKEARKKLIAADADVSPKHESRSNKDSDNIKDEKGDTNEKKEDKKEEAEKPQVEAKPIAIKRIRMKKFGISCGVVSLGEDGPEVVSQGNIVYINQDHPLYQSVYKKRELFKLHLFRLITQEIILMKKLKITAADAFKYQSKLLTDAIVN